MKINKALCNILVQRSIDSFETSRKYFRPQLLDLHDPWLMKDMDLAVHRISRAIEQKEKILVFGDYDVDGTTSVAMMFSFLLIIYREEQVEFYIPHRYREGYGISKMGIDYAHDNNFSLIISLDCGIKSNDLIEYANSLGLDFIVCDHHLPDSVLPPAIAILNPKQPECKYPYKELCGCGVGFKLITALCEKMGLEDSFYICYLDLVAIAIAADIVPVTGENRILAYHGLIKLNKNPNAGIRALMQLSGITTAYNLQNVAFAIAPRVNAAGRMDDAAKAVLMFVAENLNKALRYAEMLQIDNLDRREIESLITGEALKYIAENEALISRNSTVLFNPGWHKGVVGIVASRLIEKYYRPTVILTQSGTIVSGSARSVQDFNLYEAVHSCRQHLIGYGGHFAAAGLSMNPEEVEAFTESFERAVTASIKPHMLIPEIIIDSEIEFKTFSLSFYNIICQMEPFGPENTKPVFLSRAVKETGYSKIVKDIHIRFVLKQNDKIFTGIGFNLAEKFHLLQTDKDVDIVYTLDENEWNGEKQLQFKVLDLHLSDS